MPEFRAMELFLALNKYRYMYYIPSEQNHQNNSLKECVFINSALIIQCNL